MTSNATESPRAANRPAFQFRLTGLLAVFTLLAIVFAVIGFVVRAVNTAREAALSSNCSGRICQLTVALHNYHDTYGCFPPAVVYDSQGLPMHSWRVLLTRFMSIPEMDAYDFSLPWNHPANLRLEQFGARPFQCPGAPNEAHSTSYVLVTGPETLFPPDRCTTLKDVEGREDAILFVEIANSGIHWMEPRDLDIGSMSFQVNDPRQASISSHHPGGARIGLTDGCSGIRLENGTPPAKVKSMLLVRPR